MNVTFPKNVLRPLVAASILGVLTLGLAPGIAKSPRKRGWTYTTTTFYPTVVTTSGGLSDNDWTGTSNVFASDDAWTTVSAGTTKFLNVTGFGMSIPSGAEVTELVVVEEGHDNSPRSSVFTDSVKRHLLTAGGAAPDLDSGTPYFSGDLPFPGSPRDDVHNLGAGSTPSTYWGTTISPSVLNSSSFGYGVRLKYTDSITEYVDSIAIKVTYRVATP